MWFIAIQGTRIEGFPSYKAALAWARQNLRGDYMVAEHLQVA